MRFSASPALTVGLELELQLLDADSLDLADGIVPLLELVPGRRGVKPEFIQHTVELVTPPCRSCDELSRHLGALLSVVHERAGSLGMRLAGAGTHPFSRRRALITPLPRYIGMAKRAGFLARTQLTWGTHVHIGMPDGDTAVRVMSALRPMLPVLIALAANSPFLHGVDTGFASYRHRILAATRSYGLPPDFRSWADYARLLAMAHRAGVFDSPVTRTGTCACSRRWVRSRCARSTRRAPSHRRSSWRRWCGRWRHARWQATTTHHSLARFPCGWNARITTRPRVWGSGPARCWTRKAGAPGCAPYVGARWSQRCHGPPASAMSLICAGCSGG